VKLLKYCVEFKTRFTYTRIDSETGGVLLDKAASDSLTEQLAAHSN